jgi:hypothetical protein
VHPQLILCIYLSAVRNRSCYEHIVPNWERGHWDCLEPNGRRSEVKTSSAPSIALRIVSLTNHRRIAACPNCPLPRRAYRCLEEPSAAWRSQALPKMAFLYLVTHSVRIVAPDKAVLPRPIIYIPVYCAQQIGI